jgi:hypothetical protein
VSPPMPSIFSSMPPLPGSQQLLPPWHQPGHALDIPSSLSLPLDTVPLALYPLPPNRLHPSSSCLCLASHQLSCLYLMPPCLPTCRSPFATWLSCWRLCPSFSLLVSPWQMSKCECGACSGGTLGPGMPTRTERVLFQCM